VSENPIIVQMDLTPRPVSNYCELWNVTETNLNRWCRKGWVPGAFLHESGKWWVKPADAHGGEHGAPLPHPVRPGRIAQVWPYPEGARSRYSCGQVRASNSGRLAPISRHSDV